MRRTGVLGLVLGVLLFTAPNGAQANPLQEATATMDSGRLRFWFPAREGVTGDGHNVTIHHGSGSTWRTGRSRSWSRDWCDPCDLQVTLTYRNGTLRRVRWRIGIGDATPHQDLRDLGRVDPGAARDFLMTLVDDNELPIAEEALEAAVLSQAGVAWRTLLEIARDRQRSHDLRSTALFWLSQEAQETITGELEELVEDEDREVRKAAVFALSQRPESQSIPSLQRIVRQHRDPEIRRNALFWLAQKDSPEVADFFEEILSESDRRQD